MEGKGYFYDFFVGFLLQVDEVPFARITGEVIVADKIGDSTRAAGILQDNLKNGFIYLPFMVQELKKWDKNTSSDDFNNAVLQMVIKLKETYKPGKVN